MSPEDQLLSWIDADRDRLVGFLQDFVRIDSSNPPGDTRDVAAFVETALAGAGARVTRIAPQETMPNLVASVAGDAPARHLVLNGHLDVFPIGDRSRWSRDPLGGEIVDGRVYGRGGVDMKCGTSASIFTFLYLSRFADRLPGKLTLTVVSDEETGGRWGAEYLTEKHGADVLGDCVLNGEPSSPATVRFGEKCMFWLTFRVRTPGGHGAYPHRSASATRIAARLIRDLEALEGIEARFPDNVGRLLARPEVADAMERGLGTGAVDVVRRVTLNIGTIHGGVKVNMLPGECVFEADIRLPVGVTGAEMTERVDAILKNYPEVSVERPPRSPVDPTCSDPDHPMVGIVQGAVERIAGFRPQPVISLGGTDCRFWRRSGVPAYVYGPSPEGMGSPNEAVSIDEFLHVLRTHALSAYAYLAGSA